MKCQARIIKEYKTVKAKSIPPDSASAVIFSGPCNGDLTLIVRAVGVFVGFGDIDAQLRLDVECSRCQSPWHPRTQKIQEAIERGGGD